MRRHLTITTALVAMLVALGHRTELQRIPS